MYKVKLDRNEETSKLAKAMASKHSSVALEAQAQFADLFGPTVAEFLRQADTASMLYQTLSFDENDDIALPIALYADVVENQFDVWSNAMPGGLPSNFIMRPTDIVRFQIRRFESAYSYIKKFMRTGRVDELALALERMMQEILVKKQNDAWWTILAALANASSTYNGTTLKNVHASQTAGLLTLDDLNKAMTLFRRINSSWTGGTPVNGSSRPTDFICSPEIMENIRSFAYQPVNTKGALNAAASAGDVVPMMEDERKRLWTQAGVSEFFGMKITELNELGVGQIYTTLFDNSSSGNIPPLGSNSGGSAFNAASHDLALLVDANRFSAYRAVVSSEGGTFTLLPDDQFLARSEKIGWYGFEEAGHLVLDSKNIVGIKI